MLEQDRIIKINIEEEMKSSYIDYSMSVIVARALPDVRDGFNKFKLDILEKRGLICNYVLLHYLYYNN